MKIERVGNVNGFPEVIWQQEVPGGETAASVGRREQWQWAVLIGVVFGVVVFFSGGGWGWAVLLSLLLAGMIAAPGPFRIALGIRGLLDGSPQESEAERRLRQKRAVTPIYATEWCRASVDRATGTLMFRVWRGPDAKSLALRENLPVENFSEFELGTREEWFGDVAEREMVKLDQMAGEWMIVTLAAGRGPVVVARSGRDKAGMARLHEVLTREFVGRRREWRDG